MIPLKYNVRSLAVRRTTTAATALGVALVVWVLASALMLSAGIKKTLGTSGQPDVAIVLRAGSGAELDSTLEENQIGKILASPGVRKDDKGAPLGGGEIVVVAALEKLGANGIANVTFRGVRDNATQFRPNVKVVEGRPPRPGTNEIMVGKRVRGRFKGLELEQNVELKKNRPVHVVGVFTDEGSSYESEVWVDVDELRTAFGRQGVVNSVRARLESPAMYDAFKAQIESDKNLGFIAMREPEYFEKQSEGTSIFIGALGSIIAVFFSIGAMIGAMITMYSAVANRQKEIGTLRALGFSRGSILVSFLLESILLAFLGGALGAGASIAMSLMHFSMMNFQSWSEITFSFTPTPQIIFTALLFAGGMGLFGGLLPAVRAMRTSPVPAMRG